ncbi:Glycosyltransferase-like 1B [Quaeritorhiza haematococci]|nr:Glycosyltransferase-like 1B [Quaeritorhiza haematococci]
MYIKPEGTAIPPPFSGASSSYPKGLIPPKARAPRSLNGKRVEIRPGVTDVGSHYVLYHYHEAQNVKTYKNDVTFVTFSSKDRLHGIDGILNSWSGPVHLAYYIKEKGDELAIDKLLEENKAAADRLTVHLMWAEPDEPFPINTLRNVGQTSVKTSHLFHCDVDFLPVKRMRERLVTDFGKFLIESRKDRSMLIVPALEVVPRGKQSAGDANAQVTLPTDAQEAKMMIINNELRPFHERCKDCQEATDLKRWIDASSPYHIFPEDPTAVPERYEPYVVIARDSISWNENFAGYGRDKTLYYYELRNLQRYQNIVLSDLFIVHQDHEKSLDAQRFREKWSLEYRTSRIRIYDREQDLLHQKYLKKGLLSKEYEMRIAQRSADRKKREKSYQKSLAHMHEKRRKEAEAKGLVYNPDEPAEINHIEEVAWTHLYGPKPLEQEHLDHLLSYGHDLSISDSSPHIAMQVQSSSDAMFEDPISSSSSTHRNMPRGNMQDQLLPQYIPNARLAPPMTPRIAEHQAGVDSYGFMNTFGSQPSMAGFLGFVMLLLMFLWTCGLMGFLRSSMKKHDPYDIREVERDSFMSFLHLGKGNKRRTGGILGSPSPGRRRRHQIHAQDQ